MSLATAGRDGRPLVRMVLLKALDDRGFVFFTNLESRKARHIGENPYVSSVFPWLALERQVIVTGTAVKIPLRESCTFSRPPAREPARRMGLTAEPRHFLTQSARNAVGASEGEIWRREVPLPSFWGGFRVKPETIEFGRAVRTACTTASSIPVRMEARGPSPALPMTAMPSRNFRTRGCPPVGNGEGTSIIPPSCKITHLIAAAALLLPSAFRVSAADSITLMTRLGAEQFGNQHSQHRRRRSGHW